MKEQQHGTNTDIAGFWKPVVDRLDEAGELGSLLIAESERKTCVVPQQICVLAAVGVFQGLFADGRQQRCAADSLALDENKIGLESDAFTVVSERWHGTAGFAYRDVSYGGGRNP